MPLAYAGIVHRDPAADQAFGTTEASLVVTQFPADIPEIMRLDRWHHPDLFEDTLPSQSMTFRQLAEVLTTGDVRRYAPDMPPNTHWSNWPESGNL